MFGHEGVGIIKMIGKKVRGLKVGNKVILSWIKNDNAKDVCGSIFHNRNKINYGAVTTFGNYSLISSNRIYRLPKNIEFKSAALYGCAIPTGMGIVINEAKPKKKDKNQRTVCSFRNSSNNYASLTKVQSRSHAGQVGRAVRGGRNDASGQS